MAAGALIVMLVGGLGFALTRPATVHPRLETGARDRVGVLDPVTVVFDRTINPATARVWVSPRAQVSVKRSAGALRITPREPWQPSMMYTILLTGITGPGDKPIPRWTATFVTQPPIEVTFVADGHPVSGQAALSPSAKLSILFSATMKVDRTEVSWNGKLLPPNVLTWARDHRSLQLAMPAQLPYTPGVLAVPTAETTAGFQLSPAAQVSLATLALEPANSTSGIGPGWQTQSPSMIVVENAPPARPQSGLQGADIVFEYLSEYQTTRMTAIYFNKPPSSVGPVRSCRPINLYLGFAFDGHTLCTGASAGTLHYLWLPGHTVPGIMWDWEPRGQHFTTSPSRAAPHQVYTSGDLAGKLRSEQPVPPAQYMVDPPHPDNNQGAPAGGPQVPLHSVSWQYDGASKTYLRSDHGSAFTDTLSGQLQAKNVVVMQVPFHDSGWVEDDNGGAHSVWYTMLGAGPADVYSDGKVIHGAWHMGQNPNQDYYSNNQPVWFTDEAGHLIRLNTGLTWIHVVGQGQTS